MTAVKAPVARGARRSHRDNAHQSLVHCDGWDALSFHSTRVHSFDLPRYLSCVHGSRRREASPPPVRPSTGSRSVLAHTWTVSACLGPVKRSTDAAADTRDESCGRTGSTRGMMDIGVGDRQGTRGTVCRGRETIRHSPEAPRAVGSTNCRKQQQNNLEGTTGQ